VGESRDRPPGNPSQPQERRGPGSVPAGEERSRPAPRGPVSGARGGQLIIGRLEAYGRANYQYRAEEDVSYYVKLMTSRGARILWGKDLERALENGQTRPKLGELVGARRVRREAVTVTSRQRDGEGRVVRQEEHRAHRTRWQVEKVQFFAERARLARQVRDEQVDVRSSVRAHPELKSAFISIRAAEDYATRRIADPADRARFLELVRGAMAGSIQKGEPLPSVRLRDRRERTQPAPASAAPRKPDESMRPSAADRKRDEPTR